MLAIQVSVYLEKRRDAHRRKAGVFKTLMATRANRLSFEHVQALNMIDIEFYGKNPKDKAVITAWKAYLDVLCDNQMRDKSQDIWGARRDDAFVDLLYKMAVCLGYDFDKTSIKNTSYYPTGHGMIEDELTTIRRGFAAIFSGESALPMQIIPPEPMAEMKEQQRLEQERQVRMNQLQEDYLSGKVPQKVIIIRDETGLLAAGDSPTGLTD
jgi:hypothetical protein